MAFSRGRTFVTNSVVFAHGQPYVIPAPLMRSGAFLGYYLGSCAPFFLHPGRVMEIGAHSLLFLITAEKNAGKSFLLKDAAAKFLALQAGVGDDPNNPLAMGARFYDRKPNMEGGKQGKPLRGEFAALIDFLLGTTVSLAEQGSTNAFDPRRVDVDGAIEIAYDFANSILGRPPQNYEGPALEIAVARMFREEKQHIHALQAYLAMPGPDDVKRHYAGEHTSYADGSVAIIDDSRLYSNYCEDSTRMAGVFKTAQGGPYGGIFGGTNSHYDDAHAGDIVNYDWTGVSGPGGDLLETVFNRWEKRLLRLQSPRNPYLWVLDEEGTRIKNLPHATSFAEYVREARAHSRITFLATQFSTDFDNLGSAGSPIRELGREINRGISVRIYGRQPNTPEIVESITRQRVSLGDALSTTLLPQGCWGIKLPDRPIQFFQHVAAPHMLPIYETNRAAKSLARGYSAEEVPYAKERLRKINALWPSVRRQLNQDPLSYKEVHDGFYDKIGETREPVDA